MMKMFRSFLVFPLSLNIPGKGLFRKLIGENKTYHPVYNQTETGEVIFYKGKIFKDLKNKTEIFSLYRRSVAKLWRM